ncbi:protein-L-isoaspartate O-methyltransferase family protein [Hwanghaeella sp.]|uniref:protein-L-isoaspartate O-methyltransferase family protein n=1 Tax=Hwanghaeella sp. TaxID=2605943 RepID=UPI003CCBB07D
MDYALARQNMIESQLRTNKITQENLLDAIRKVPREQFLPLNKQKFAYLDEDIPLGAGRYETEPMVLATLIQALKLGPQDDVLVVGAAAGYSAAVIGQIAKSVFALESEHDLAARASDQLTQFAFDNVVVVEGPLTEGKADQGPFDAILVNGAVAEIPTALTAQLKDGGRLAAVVRPGEDKVGTIRLAEKAGGTVAERTIANASIPFLKGFEPKPAFTF